MGCAMSACSGLTTTKLASDEENHYRERRANGKQGVVDIANEGELSREKRPGRISDNESEIDQTLPSLHCDPQISRAEAAHNVRAGEILGEQMTPQRATPKRKREVRSAQTKGDEEYGALATRSRKRTNILGALLLAILSRGRRHSSTRIDVTRNSPLDSSIEIENQQPITDRAHTTVTAKTQLSSPAPEMVQSSEHSQGCESHQAGGQLAMSRSTPTIKLDGDQQAEGSNRADEVSLFTSMHQLCYEIINRKLTGLNQHSELSAQHLCLFVFGRPGSSRGELAFELAEHSSLVDFIARLEGDSQQIRLNQSEVDHTHGCPLYHYLDVSSLIVTNIDSRIREYNRLVAGTLRSRRQQLVSAEASSLDSRASNKSREEEEEQEEEPDEIESETISESSRVVDLSQESRYDDDEDELRTTNTSRDLQSTGSDLFPARPKEPKISNNDHQPENERTSSDQFGPITLCTKQRSILQLKMIKYACCVTAKWVMHLLRREIGLLEERLARAASDKHVPPRRVYLVNLVPNQLSLFKTCLYLQQSLPLGQLRMPHWAVKFERRTNIKLIMNKERATALAGSTASQTATGQEHHSITLANPTGKRVLIQFKRLSQIKLPTILATGTVAAAAAASTPNTATKDIDNLTGRQDQTQKNIGSVAANLLANGPNEKLGPKYNDLFAQQFDSLNKLTKLRYNPTRNYNYSDEFDYLLQDSDVGRTPSSTPTNELAPSPLTSDSCYLKLSHLIDFEHHHEPPSPSSLSQVSSRAGSQLMLASGESGRHPTPSLQIDESTSTGRLLVSPSPSPCPSSVASDESSGLSYDFSYHHQRQQLSPTCALDGSGHFRFQSNVIVQHQAGLHPLKWAVELQLIDEQTLGDSTGRWYQQSGPTCYSDEQTALGQPNQPETFIMTDCCLHVYNNDKRRPMRSRSHASLLAPSSSANQVPGTCCQADNYYLVATRVAYATGKSQPVFEVKRLHKRAIKCSGSRSDLIKLRKLINKARICLMRDLDTWLRESIFDRPQSPTQIPKPYGHHGTKSIALITYTIRVDVSKFASCALSASAREVRPEHQRQPECSIAQLEVPRPHSSAGANGEHHKPTPSSDPIVQLLNTQPKRSNLVKQRPSSARQLSDSLGAKQQEACVVSPDGLSLQLPGGGSSRNGAGQGDSSTRSSSPRQRHVQFRLGQAPLSVGSQIAADEHVSSTCDAQRRLWLRDNLFASSNESRLLATMDALVAALKSIDTG